jgi:hypothetical protein
MRRPSFSGALLPRLGCLGFVAMIAFVWAFSVIGAVAVMHHEQQGCDRPPGIGRVLVPRSSVTYARANGWPRVLVVGDRFGGPVLYDHSREASRVRAGAARFCDGVRYRIVAR